MSRRSKTAEHNTNNAFRSAAGFAVPEPIPKHDRQHDCYLPVKAEFRRNAKKWAIRTGGSGGDHGGDGGGRGCSSRRDALARSETWRSHQRDAVRSQDFLDIESSGACIKVAVSGRYRQAVGHLLEATDRAAVREEDIRKTVRLSK